MPKMSQNPLPPLPTLKNESMRICVCPPLALASLLELLRIRSSLKFFSLHMNSTSASSSGSVHCCRKEMSENELSEFHACLSVNGTSQSPLQPVFKTILQQHSISQQHLALTALLSNTPQGPQTSPPTFNSSVSASTTSGSLKRRRASA